MSDQTANLALPYILPSQAQKHVTHNEGLQRLDALVQLVIAAEHTAPPEAPDEGQCFLIKEGASGDWAGMTGRLAFRQDGSWIYLQPRRGWQALFLELEQIRCFDGNAWRAVSLTMDGSIAMLGINTTPDEVNRLAAASDASLFSHAGNGHQMKINKAAASDTGSLLFQTAWSGRAEMGLAGNDEFAVKVSADGDTWMTALAISQHGVVETPARPVIRTSLAAATLSPAAGTRTGFDELHLQQGNGFELGAAVPSGSGHRLTAKQSGLYLVTLNTRVISSSGHAAAIEINGTTPLASIEAAASTFPSRQSVCAVISLVEGDWLALLHSGAAQYEFGAGKTELTFVML
ncbi:DUF2793 domain-containing protein [Rhizobium sp. S152]|uniref:DUF2793 domain-containing protein n=1 Tax=Rhizobium sp. S152 TaxID=3055038 RepID=UPI0025AA14CB|nr:DUF2793 domain-containing protein [Rhizobium sp. S152]MDM9626056.1 DUF2793 domain-containing protein [Rhizobium sp. S152]